MTDIERNEVDEKQKKPSTFRSLEELIALDVPEPSYIWDGEISENEQNCWAGHPNVTKSLLCHGLITSIAHGDDFLGRKTKKGTVILIDKESSINTLVSRFKRLNRGFEKSEFKHKAYVYTPQEMKVIPADMLKIAQMVEKFKPILVIFDSFSRFFEGDENSSADVRRVFELLKPLMDKYRVTFLFIHHCVKSSGKVNIFSLRGSGDLIASCGSVSVLNRLQNGVIELEQVKNRNGELSKKIVFRVDDVETQKGKSLKINLVGEYANEFNIDEFVNEWINKNIEINQKFKSGAVYGGLEKFDENSLRDSLKSLSAKGKIFENGKGKWIRKS